MDRQSCLRSDLCCWYHRRSGFYHGQFPRGHTFSPVIEFGASYRTTPRHLEESQNNPKLARIRDPHADLYTKPVTQEETQFVMLLMFHLHCWYRAIQEGEVSVLEGLELDIQNFFHRPIPRHVWSERRAFFDSDFRHFIDGVLKK